MMRKKKKGMDMKMVTMTTTFHLVMNHLQKMKMPLLHHQISTSSMNVILILQIKENAELDYIVVLLQVKIHNTKKSYPILDGIATRKSSVAKMLMELNLIALDTQRAQLSSVNKKKRLSKNRLKMKRLRKKRSKKDWKQRNNSALKRQRRRKTAA